ncbi:MAG: SET domain-containing protein [archaeon]
MNHEKEKVIQKIKNTYCRIMPSKLHGVGVFAIRDIPKDINPFGIETKQKWVRVHLKDLGEIHPNLNEMIEAFYVIKKDGSVWINSGGLGSIGISFYMNTSKNPNMKTIDEGFTFITSKEIKCGEELLADYGEFDWKYKQSEKDKTKTKLIKKNKTKGK